MTIHELLNNNTISRRTYNVCEYNNLFTEDDIREYYKENQSFKNFINCGKKTSDELLALCESETIIVENETHDLLQGELSSGSKIADLFRSNIISLRLYNICYMNALFTLNDIVEFYIRNKSFIHLKNAGEKTNVELYNLIKELLPQFEERISIDKQRTLEENNALLIILFPLN